MVHTREMANPANVPTGIDFLICTSIESAPMASGSIKKDGRQYPSTRPSMISVSYR